MKRSLHDAQPYAEAYARLLHPFAEVVIHDLEKDQIEAIYNPLSRREVGDCSYLDRVDLDPSENVIGPYPKTNWDGRAMKSISIVIRNTKGIAEGFLCVNIDTSQFDAARHVLQTFLGGDTEIPEDAQRLFEDDHYEKLNLYVQNYCRQHQVGIETLTRSDKKEIISSLAADGAFKGRNAATYIGRVLNVSRATVYNYLKEQEVS